MNKAGFGEGNPYTSRCDVIRSFHGFKMVAAISEADSTDPSNSKASSQGKKQQQQSLNQSPTGPPLLPSEKDNGFIQRRPKGRQVPSRYMSPSPSISTSISNTSTSSSRRCPSPLLSRSTNFTPASTPSPFTVPKRSQSVDRRRPSTPRSMTPVHDSRQGNTGDASAAAKLLVTSTRSLSVSFQGEAFSLPISKTKAATPTLCNARKATPERRRSTPIRGKGEERGEQVENSRPIEQHRWPARARSLNSSSNLLSRSLDCSSGDKKVIGNGYGKVVRSLQHKVIDETKRTSIDGRFSLELSNGDVLKAPTQKIDGNSRNESTVHSYLTPSDTDSVSSGSTSGVQECGGISKGKNEPRGIVVSAKFWQETNSRLRRLQDPGSPLSTSPSSRMSAATKFPQSKKFTNDGTLSSPRTMSSPMRGASRPASPTKLWASLGSSPSRGISSPARVRSSVTTSLNNNNNTPSILSFSVDIRRGKMGEDRIMDAHMMRLLYNRYLQWRFINASADATFIVQKVNAERYLWNAWATKSELWHSVTLKRIKLLLLRQKLKLTSILRGHINYLEEWALLDKDHSSSLHGATEALRASTFRLPVVEKTVADIQSLKEAVGSAVDMMQSMASSIYSLSSKVEEINSLVAELVNVTAMEKVLLEQCKEFLSSLAAMQVKDCSLRTHTIQFNHVRTTGSLTTRV